MTPWASILSSITAPSSTKLCEWIRHVSLCARVRVGVYVRIYVRVYIYAFVCICMRVSMHHFVFVPISA